MKNRPRLSHRERRQLPNGILLDAPTACELGCGNPAYIDVAGVAICRMHYGRALDIRATAERHHTIDIGPLGRKPVTVAVALQRAVA